MHVRSIPSHPVPTTGESAIPRSTKYIHSRRNGEPCPAGFKPETGVHPQGMRRDHAEVIGCTLAIRTPHDTYELGCSGQIEMANKDRAGKTVDSSNIRI